MARNFLITSVEWAIVTMFIMVFLEGLFHTVLHVISWIRYLISFVLYHFLF